SDNDRCRAKNELPAFDRFLRPARERYFSPDATSKHCRWLEERSRSGREAPDSIASREYRPGGGPRVLSLVLRRRIQDHPRSKPAEHPLLIRLLPCPDFGRKPDRAITEEHRSGRNRAHCGRSRPA